MTKIRQPIVTIAGHVDHGKTSILDSVRASAVQEGEAGGITQKISFTLFPSESIVDRCPLIDKSGFKLEIPGFLFIDTPGHAAFSNLRKRGGALADLAILVIDINDGIKPQTAEVIEIMKHNKTPFIIALNKIDNISGWHQSEEGVSVVENIKKQAMNVGQEFQEKMLTLVGSLHSHGFKAAPYYEVKDFTSEIALVPCSARTGEGIKELLFTLCGLSQKFLKESLKLGNETKGVVLEIKKEKTINYLESIVYDGVLKSGDEIAIASFGEPVFSKIRILEEILPISSKFKPVQICQAATGIRMQLKDSVEVLPGMPFRVINSEKDKKEIIEEFKKEVVDKVKVDNEGVIIKADSLGSLEALITLLKQEGIKICKAGIGSIDKRDVISANTNLERDECDAVILGFNVTHEEDIKELPLKKIKIIEDEVVYKLIEAVKEYRDEKRKEVEKKKLMKLASVCKLKILPEYVFHNSNPAIFGVKVEAGKLRANTVLMDEEGVAIGKVSKIQADKKSVEEATSGMEIAISVTGTNFERQLAEKNYLYSDLGEGQFREFKKNKELLTSEEVKVLQSVSQIKRKEKTTWGV
jgi:translation initiation factor 5B